MRNTNIFSEREFQRQVLQLARLSGCVVAPESYLWRPRDLEETQRTLLKRKERDA